MEDGTQVIAESHLQSLSPLFRRYEQRNGGVWMTDRSTRVKALPLAIYGSSLVENSKVRPGADNEEGCIPGLTHHNSEYGLYGKFRIPSKPRLLPYSLATFR